MPIINQGTVTRAMRTSTWQLSNNVLYDFCAKYPEHKKTNVALGKIMLIGRVYAAAIERRKSQEGENENTQFFLDVVGPALLNSDIDAWIAEARAVRRRKKNRFDTLVSVHHKTTQLFNAISKMEKRSLASKYLHFHVPSLFYIYDSRAVGAFRQGVISGLDEPMPRATNTKNLGDNEYRKFAEKCEYLRTYCRTRFQKTLSPRQLDNLLLEINER